MKLTLFVTLLCASLDFSFANDKKQGDPKAKGPPPCPPIPAPCPNAPPPPPCGPQNKLGDKVYCARMTWTPDGSCVTNQNELCNCDAGYDAGKGKTLDCVYDDAPYNVTHVEKFYCAFLGTTDFIKPDHCRRTNKHPPSNNGSN